MTEEKSKSSEPAKQTGNDYQAPAVEEVIKREDVEREVAYAGVIGPSQQQN
jgi:hypothetical protein